MPIADYTSMGAPASVREVDISGSPDDEISVDGRILEVVEGPTSEPYGTLEIKLAGSATWETLTRLEVGWEHPMQLVAIKKTGSSVTRVRVWR